MFSKGYHVFFGFDSFLGVRPTVKRGGWNLSKSNLFCGDKSKVAKIVCTAMCKSIRRKRWKVIKMVKINQLCVQQPKFCAEKRQFCRDMCLCVPVWKVWPFPYYGGSQGAAVGGHTLEVIFLLLQSPVCHREGPKQTMCSLLTSDMLNNVSSSVSKTSCTILGTSVAGTRK